MNLKNLAVDLVSRVVQFFEGLAESVFDQIVEAYDFVNDVGKGKEDQKK